MCTVTTTAVAGRPVHPSVRGVVAGMIAADSGEARSTTKEEDLIV
jgi:hypothetical protein